MIPFSFPHSRQAIGFSDQKRSTLCQNEVMFMRFESLFWASEILESGTGTKNIDKQSLKGSFLSVVLSLTDESFR